MLHSPDMNIYKFICKVIFIGTIEPLHNIHLGGWQKKGAIVA